MKSLYNIGIHSYSLGIRLAGIFGNNKAKKWVSGRKKWRENVKKSIDSSKKTIWIHATSLGEFEQVKPLIEKIKSDSSFNDFQIIITFFSPSGFEYSKGYKLADNIFYLPSDTKNNASDFISLIQPQIAIFVKYDFWFNYLAELQYRGIPHLFFGCNFRENQIYFKSGNKWQVKILQKINFIFTLNQSSLNVLKSKGFSNIKICGDTRFDKVIQNANRCLPIELIENFKQGKRLLILGSSWEKEEEILAKYLSKHTPDLKIIVAPHNVYGTHIEDIIKLLPVKSLRFSEVNKETINSVDLLIIDNIGMLSNLYQYSDIAFIGGGFTNRLHNILEAATFSNALLFGNYHAKFPEGKQLIEAKGGFDLKNEKDFTLRLNSFLDDIGLLQKTQQKAKSFIEDNKGATNIVFEKVKDFR